MNLRKLCFVSFVINYIRVLHNSVHMYVMQNVVFLLQEICFLYKVVIVLINNIDRIKSIEKRFTQGLHNRYAVPFIVVCYDSLNN